MTEKKILFFFFFFILCYRIQFLQRVHSEKAKTYNFSHLIICVDRFLSSAIMYHETYC